MGQAEPAALIRIDVLHGLPWHHSRPFTLPLPNHVPARFGGHRTASSTSARDPEPIAFTASINATGLFEGEPETGLLLPFEGMGVDSVWQLELPKAANPFDYSAIDDVLLTLDELTIPALRHTVGADPTGDWELQLDDTPLVRSWFASGLIQDLVLVFTLAGTTPAWT